MSSALLADGLRAVVEDGLELSPPAEVLFVSALRAGEVVAGAALPQLSQAAVEALPAEFSSAVASAAGQALKLVPALGAFVGLFLELVGVLREQDQALAQKRAADCEQWFALRAVPSTGSKLGGCEQCPADLFARTLKLKGFHGRRFRPLLGEALVAVTEGWQVDQRPEEACSTRTGKNRDSCEQVLAQAGGAWRAKALDVARRRNPAAGVPEERRRTFARVRQAIEASYRARGDETPSDGGVGLWPAYLDLLLREWDEGHLDRPTIELLIGSTLVDGELLTSNGNTLWPCFVPALSDAVVRLIDGWRDTVRPRYDEGKKRLDELRREQEKANMVRDRKEIREAVQATPEISPTEDVQAAAAHAVTRNAPKGLALGIAGGLAALLMTGTLVGFAVWKTRERREAERREVRS